MSTMAPHPSPIFPDQFPILGSGMNGSNMLPTSPNSSFREGDNRFCPSDERLINHYLIQKMLGNEDQVIQIPEVDILNHEPWDLLPTGGEQGYKEAFYFCRRRSYFTSKDRYKRTTGGGYWKPTGNHRKVRTGAHGEVIGSKRSLVFHYGRPAGQSTDYTMHEYSVPNCIGQILGEGLVLCKIMKKISNHNNKTKTKARKLSKKRKEEAIPPIIPSKENIDTITLPSQQEEVGTYKVASDFRNQNVSFQEAVSNDHGSTMEEILFGDGDDHSQLPDIDFDFDFELDSAVRDMLPPPESEPLLG